MESKLFTVTFNMLTKNVKVSYCPEAVVANNVVHFFTYPHLLIHVYAGSKDEALKVAKIDIQNQLRALSENAVCAIDRRISIKSYRVTYNLKNSDIVSIHEQEESGKTPTSDYPEDVDKVKHTGAYILEVVVMSLNKRGAKDKALDLISEYFSDKAKKAAERKRVVEEFDDEDQVS